MTATSTREISRRLDNTLDLLAGALQHLSTLETRLQRHEYTVTDLHRDAVKIMATPGTGDTADHQRDAAVQTVRDGSEQLVRDLNASVAAAATGHTLLSSAGRQVAIAQLLLDDLGAIDAGPSGATNTAGAPAQQLTGEIAHLKARTARLADLVEATGPIADRALRQVRGAQQILQTEVAVDDRPEVDQLRRFWSMDQGIFSGAQAVSRARGTAIGGSELLAAALTRGPGPRGEFSSTAGRPSLTVVPPPPPGPRAPAGPSI